MRSYQAVFVILAVLAAWAPACALSGPFTPGNLVVAMGDSIFEYSRSGTMVQALPIPYGGGERPPTETARDLLFDDADRLCVYNGGYAPDLAVFAQDMGQWRHHPCPGWSSFNRYAGLVCSGSIVYATDMATGDDGAPAGIVRFQIDGEAEGERVVGAQDYRDLSVGPDGQLFGLASETTIHVYDPADWVLQKSIDLERPCRAIAVLSDATLLGGSWNGIVYRFDSSGTVQQSLETGVSSLNDLDVDKDGWIASGSREGSVVLIDPALTNALVWNVGEMPVYVAFVGAHE